MMIFVTLPGNKEHLEGAMGVAGAHNICHIGPNGTLPPLGRVAPARLSLEFKNFGLTPGD